MTQHFQRGEIWKTSSTQHEVVDAEVNERLHLLYDLRWSADKGIAGTHSALIERFDFGFRRRANAASVPCTSKRGRVAMNFVAGAFAFGYLLTILLNTRPSDIVLCTFFMTSGT